MNSEQVAAIERLRELDRRVGYWNWEQDEQFSHHVLYDDGFCFSVCETDSADALPTHAEFIVTLRNEALPLIEALQQENERLRAGVGRALGELEAGKPGDAESILETLHDA